MSDDEVLYEGLRDALALAIHQLSEDEQSFEKLMEPYYTGALPTTALISGLLTIATVTAVRFYGSDKAAVDGLQKFASNLATMVERETLEGEWEW